MASTLGDKIRACRTELNMSLDRLAELTDSSKSYLWELENRDKPNPSVEKVARIAEALSVTTEFLLDKTETTPDEADKDKVFFRKYQQLKPEDKVRLRKFLDAWDDES